MHKVKQAIIMAAGIGQRMRPLTEKTPKPLIYVNGVRMIDTVINGLKNNGIDEIYIVVGYLKEQFYPLAGEYGVVLIDNPMYNECNNIASLYFARNHLEDSIILDGDQVIYNDKILTAEFKKSGYNAVWTDTYTNEWLLEVENNMIKSCNRNGGEKGWQLYSISRWCKKDAEKLKKYIEYEFEENKNRQIYWDDVALFCHPDKFQLGILPMAKDDIVEIDSISELVEIDNSYNTYRSNGHE